MGFDLIFTTGDLITIGGFLLALVVARNGIEQWRAELTVRLIDEYSDIEVREARSRLRQWMREIGPAADWQSAIAERFASDLDFVGSSLGSLCRYYNRVGILLERGVLVRPLILGEMRSDAALFEQPLSGWIEFTLQRRRADLDAAQLSPSLLGTYWRGTKVLLRACRGR